jgi:Mg/Co/Ni transporter MgtE
MARSPGRPPSRPVDVKRAGLAFDDAREVIQSVNADTGVAMLLAMPDDQAARILASYPSRVSGELLQGIATARPGTVGAILRMLWTADAGRVVGYLKPDSAAVILAGMPIDEAARILSHAGVRTAAGIIAEMPVEVSAAVTKAMQVNRAAEVLAYVKPATVAALLLATSDGSNGRLLQQFKPAFRAQVMRFL